MDPRTLKILYRMTVARLDSHTAADLDKTYLAAKVMNI